MEVEAPTEPPTGRRRSSPSSSPEFEFCALGGTLPALPPPQIHTADELFSNGVLLPLHHLSIRRRPAPDHVDDALTPAPASPSKRWKEALRAANKDRRTRDRKGGGSGVAELNIHLWPFTRSRSAGFARPARSSSSSAPQQHPAGRKSSSAPCSRSNSLGDHTEAKPPSMAPAAAAKKIYGGAGSCSRPKGLHLGRPGAAAASWRFRRGNNNMESKKKGEEAAEKKISNSNSEGVVEVEDAAAGMTIVSKKTDKKAAAAAAAAANVVVVVEGAGGGGGAVIAGGGGGAVIAGGGIARLKSLFTKKGGQVS